MVEMVEMVERIFGHKMKRKLCLACLLLLLGCSVFVGCADKKPKEAPAVTEDEDVPDQEVEFEEQ